MEWRCQKIFICYLIILCNNDAKFLNSWPCTPQKIFLVIRNRQFRVPSQNERAKTIQFWQSGSPTRSFNQIFANGSSSAFTSLSKTKDGHTQFLSLNHSLSLSLALVPVWPDWAIYWILGNFLKHLATINLPKSTRFLGNFCNGVKI